MTNLKYIKVLVDSKKWEKLGYIAKRQGMTIQGKVAELLDRELDRHDRYERRKKP